MAALPRSMNIPIMPEVYAIRFDGTMPPSIMEYEEVYRDHNSRTVRTVGQDREIERLKKELEVKKQKTRDLIAYYYKR